MSFLHDLYAANGRTVKSRGIIILGDKSPYVSPMDRTVVDGYSSHREHMKRHGVVEAGDMPLGTGSAEKPLDRVRPDLERAIQELS